MPLRRAVNSGNWSSSSTWENGVVPQNGDDITILSGVTVTFNISSFTAGTVTLEHNSFLLFPTTGERTLQATNLFLRDGSGLDFVQVPDTNSTAFVNISITNNFSVDNSYVWFGSNAYSERQRNLSEGEWGLIVAETANSGSTQIKLSPSSFYTIIPSIVSYLSGKTLLIATSSTLVNRTISSATYSNNILTVTLSSGLPTTVPAGCRCLILPDPFSTLVFLSVTNPQFVHFFTTAHTLRLTNASQMNLFIGDGILWDSAVSVVKGKNWLFVDTRSSGANPSLVSGNRIGLCSSQPINFSVFAEKVSVEFIGNGLSSNTVAAEIVKIPVNCQMSGQNFKIDAYQLDGFLNLACSNAFITATKLNLKSLSWTSQFNPSNTVLKLGDDQTSQSIETSPDWNALMSHLTSSSWTGKTGLVEIRNIPPIALLRADYSNGDFVLYSTENKPCRVDIQSSLRHDNNIIWGKFFGSSAVKQYKEVPAALGVVWEKDELALTATNPAKVFSTATGKEVILQPGKPDFEVMEGAHESIVITPPSAGRIWLFNERTIKKPLDEPWLLIDDANDEIRFHLPATSATLQQLPLLIARPEASGVAKGWRWSTASAKEYAQINYYISEEGSKYFAAIVLRQSTKGWKCLGFLWYFPVVDSNNFPYYHIFSRPTLTVLNQHNIAFGLTYYSFMRLNGMFKRLAYQDRIYDDWNADPIPSEIPVSIVNSNITLNNNPKLILRGKEPYLEFYDGQSLVQLGLRHYLTEFEKISLKSPAEVNTMFAANLRARLVVTGTATSGSVKSQPTDKFAITFILVCGRGRVYFWDWFSGTRDPNNPSDLQECKLIFEVNNTIPTVVSFSPIMFPAGLYIIATKASNDPFISVFVYSD